MPDGPNATGAAAPVPGPAAPPYVDPATKSTQPIYDYADAVRESVYVDTKMDTDADGTNDVVAVDIVRPRETDLTGLRIPVIMDASPYYSCCGRGNESEKKTYDENGVIQKMPLFYDNYFVPAGTPWSASTSSAPAGRPAAVTSAARTRSTPSSR